MKTVMLKCMNLIILPSASQRKKMTEHEQDMLEST